MHSHSFDQGRGRPGSRPLCRMKELKALANFPRKRQVLFAVINIRLPFLMLPSLLCHLSINPSRPCMTSLFLAAVNGGRAATKERAMQI